MLALFIFLQPTCISRAPHTECCSTRKHTRLNLRCIIWEADEVSISWATVFSLKHETFLEAAFSLPWCSLINLDCFVIYLRLTADSLCRETTEFLLRSISAWNFLFLRGIPLLLGGAIVFTCYFFYFDRCIHILLAWYATLSNHYHYQMKVPLYDTHLQELWDVCCWDIS